MFTDQAWAAGYDTAEKLGLMQSFAPLARPVTKRDVEKIVSAVVNHGFEEMYVDQVLPDDAAEDMQADALERLREHMRGQLARQALKANCVMITLPREVTDHPERGLTRLRLIVPVRRVEQQDAVFEHAGFGICNKGRKHAPPCDYGNGV